MPAAAAATSADTARSQSSGSEEAAASGQIPVTVQSTVPQWAAPAVLRWGFYGALGYVSAADAFSQGSSSAVPSQLGLGLGLGLTAAAIAAAAVALAVVLRRRRRLAAAAAATDRVATIVVRNSSKTALPPARSTSNIMPLAGADDIGGAQGSSTKLKFSPRANDTPGSPSGTGSAIALTATNVQQRSTDTFPPHV